MVRRDDIGEGLCAADITRTGEVVSANTASGFAADERRNLGSNSQLAEALVPLRIDCPTVLKHAAGDGGYSENGARNRSGEEPCLAGAVVGVATVSLGEVFGSAL
jgi:hypothetical protein